jgi:hypothetical protein
MSPGKKSVETDSRATTIAGKRSLLTEPTSTERSGTASGGSDRRGGSSSDEASKQGLCG